MHGLSPTTVTRLFLRSGLVRMGAPVGQSATFREAKQVSLLLDVFRAGLDVADPLARLPVPVTLFVAHGLSILLRPEHSLYPLLNRFLLQRPAMDLTDMPMFYGLFYSPSPEHRGERIWILRLLANGLKTSQVRSRARQPLAGGCWGVKTHPRPRGGEVGGRGREHVADIVR